MESGFNRILTMAKQIRIQRGRVEPVGLLEYGEDCAALVPMDLSTNASRLGSMVGFGQACRNNKATRAFVIQEVLMKAMSYEERERTRHLPPPQDIPADDQRLAIFIFEINFDKPTHCAGLLQEYKALGRATPEFLEPVFNYPIPANGAFVAAVKAYHGDNCGLPGTNFTEHPLTDNRQNVDVDDFLEDLGLQ